MAVSGQRLIGAARDSGLVRLDEVNALLEEARRGRKDPLELVSSRLRLPREAFYRALAAQKGLPFRDAEALVPDPARLARLPARLLLRKGVLPVRSADGAPTLATSDPEDSATLEAIGPMLDGPVRLVISDPEALSAALRRAIGGGATMTPAEVSAFDPVGALDDLLRQAWLHRASDLHLDPQEGGVSVRLRVDGLLRAHGPVLAHEDGHQLLTRIKVLGGLDIAERREPQDGGFAYKIEEAGQPLDIRLATIPTRHGERATLRLLGLETRQLTLDNLGFSAQALARTREALDEPHGLILLTGPTGSGKSTTLYAALRELARPEHNVVTVEDPVEFVIPGISQVQVDRAGKVTFAGALRSLLRHDPDVLMVGEIRDGETAEVALQAALTGHLVLSSLHTNRAAGAPLRLIDLGSEPFLVASTLRGALAQRLVRRLCVTCKQERPGREQELARFGLEHSTANVWEPIGCPACLGSGYRGRLAVTEAVWVDAGVSAAIERRAPQEELIRLSRIRGGWTLMEDALDKVLTGQTSPAEAWLARA